MNNVTYTYFKVKIIGGKIVGVLWVYRRHVSGWMLVTGSAPKTNGPFPGPGQGLFAGLLHFPHQHYNKTHSSDYGRRKPNDIIKFFSDVTLPETYVTVTDASSLAIFCGHRPGSMGHRGRVADKTVHATQGDSQLYYLQILLCTASGGNLVWCLPHCPRLPIQTNYSPPQIF